MNGRNAFASLFATVALAFLVWRPLAVEHRTAVATTCAFVAPGAAATTTARSDRARWCLSSRLGMSTNDIVPTNGLTTTSGGVQRGGGAQLRPESELFIPAPTLDATKTDFATRPAGAPHFGDIMGGTDGKGADLLHHFKPLERVILTANGNLQRVISSYYDSPVTVDIKRCEEVEPSVYDREVALSVLGREFCVAKSLVILHSPACVEAVKRGDVGIGQLFRFLDVLPNFELLNAGRLVESSNGERRQAPRGRPSKGGGLWRIYDLRSRHVSCRIHEEFHPDLFDLTG